MYKIFDFTQSIKIVFSKKLVKANEATSKKVRFKNSNIHRLDAKTATSKLNFYFLFNKVCY